MTTPKKTEARSANVSDERWQILSMKAVDGLLDDDERAELEQILEASPERRAELEDYVDIKRTTDGLTARILADADIEPPRASTAARSWIGVSFLLILTGALILLTYGTWLLFTDPSTPAIVKLGLAIGGVGLLGLLSWTLKTRLRGGRREPYRELDR